MQLVQDKTSSTGQTYALKAISKSMLVETNQHSQIMSEKNVSSESYDSMATNPMRF